VKHRFRGHRGFDLGAPRSGRPGKSPLTDGVLASNIDTATPGSVRIALWREWRAMLDDLRNVGPVWSIVRNRQCVLAVQSVYPELTFSADQQSAGACDGDRSLTYYLPAWQQATAFDCDCHCGRTHGLEIENTEGETFHRICLAKGTDLTQFADWIRLHQATGLEADEIAEALDIQEPSPYLSPIAGGFPPGTLQFPPHLLRSVMITAAQREIQLIASAANDGISQTARLDVLRASEAHGWLVLSGKNRSLYVESAPTGTLYLEPGNLEGESLWRLSLVDARGQRVMRLQSGVDGRASWNQLIREVVLSSRGLES
jgi:hypothetical protein